MLSLLSLSSHCTIKKHYITALIHNINNNGNNSGVTSISGHWAGFVRSVVQTGPVVEGGSG